MAFKEHPKFSGPENGDCIIWRYLDFAKLVSLFEDNSLFLSSIDMLEDQFEGYFTKANVF